MSGECDAVAEDLSEERVLAAVGGRVWSVDHLPVAVGLQVTHTAAEDTRRSPASGELHRQSCYLSSSA